MLRLLSGLVQGNTVIVGVGRLEDTGLADKESKCADLPSQRLLSSYHSVAVRLNDTTCFTELP